ncbi:uncharacterized protein LOC127600313 [Hippocampus zosterae]|uniref:uncharacterized protein LOC127600313 n=1 Tax=Hippocampus zosterae TaxID=109293 RepID=UPI00223D6405|nr:uncharacterized protein LOC127600313 [Hippocampus zosterae]XP_051920763.1 uncharacterized protein LOC127600313 [Hippocampus zosterae]XP_051920764.1 uncharacterized protein LOC127600313 [Hippocampus zosterae]
MKPANPSAICMRLQSSRCCAFTLQQGQIVHHDGSTASKEVLVVSHDASDYNSEIEEVSVDSNEIYTPFGISVDSEITFGPTYNTEGDADITLIYDGPPDPQDVMTITVHYTDTLNDMIIAFSENAILNKSLNVKRILPDNTEEAGVGSGVLRDVISCFWQEFYDRCTLGTSIKVPFIRHDFPAEKWKAVGRILLKGYQDCCYFPNKLAFPFLEQVLFNCVYSDLKAHFLQFMSSQEGKVLMEAMKDFSEVDLDDLVEVLDSYGCRKRISAETFPTILQEMAHKELIQKPMFVIDCWREVTLHRVSISLEALNKLCSDLQPTSKKVCQLLKFATDLTPKQIMEQRLKSSAVSDHFDVLENKVKCRICQVNSPTEAPPPC